MRFLHLLGAAYWLGGVITLAVIALVAARSLERPAFQTLMVRAGWTYASGAVAAGALLAGTGIALAGQHLTSVAGSWTTSWGRTLLLKTALALLVMLLTLGHAIAGTRGGRTARIATRGISPVIAALTLAIFALGVRLAG